MWAKGLFIFFFLGGEEGGRDTHTLFQKKHKRKKITQTKEIEKIQIVYFIDIIRIIMALYLLSIKVFLQ